MFNICGMVDFDNTDDWAPTLATALAPHVPESIGQKLTHAAPEFIEDALDLVFENAVRNDVIDATLSWIRSNVIVFYHGTRLTDEEVVSVRTIGLVPLKAEDRRCRLIRALSLHPRWPEVANQLDVAIQAYGSGHEGGIREGQVHLTLSKAGLTDSFDQFLKYGSEFDMHVASKLLGTDGKDLLTHDGKPRVIQVAVSGQIALDAANLYFSVDDTRAGGDVPYIVKEFLKTWSYRLAHPGLPPRTPKINSGITFCTAVPAASITEIETLTD